MLLHNNMGKQLKHHEIKFDKAVNLQIEILLDQIDSPANLGSIFRNAEAFGIKTIWMNETNRKSLESNRFKRTSRSTEKNLNFEFYKTFQDVIHNFEGTKIGIEITNNSENITKIKQSLIDNTLIVVGNEKFGIADNILEKLDKVYHIKMFGENSSLNVSQTLGIALHEIRREV